MCGLSGILGSSAHQDVIKHLLYINHLQAVLRKRENESNHNNWGGEKKHKNILKQQFNFCLQKGPVTPVRPGPTNLSSLS